MNVERIRERLHEEKFRPFAVVTSSRHTDPAPHSDFIFLTQKIVIVANTQGSTKGIDPLHIVALEDLSSHKNGSLRRGGQRK